VRNLVAETRYRNVGWARQVARHPAVGAAAILGIAIAVVLESSVLVVLGKSLWLQSSLQAFYLAHRRDRNLRARPHSRQSSWSTDHDGCQ
jgi:hypothetical protein